MNRRLFAFSLLLIPASCATIPRGDPDLDQRTNWSTPLLERAISVRDGRTGRDLSLDAFLDTLAKADAVFLGETHTDETTHRVELGVYEGLLARRRGHVVLAMEMFERDVQPDLDAYLAGQIDEPAFLARTRPWSNYRTAYRPLIEMAKLSGHPVVASNFPQPLRQRVALEGPAVLTSLEGDARRQAPAKLLPNTAEYWRRADNAVRSHRAIMGGGADDRLCSTQSLWDNAMGEACALALDAHPGHLVLHLNGGFHSAYWDGIVHQLLARRPRTKVLTVDITPVTNPRVAEVEGVPVADYEVFVEARATDVEQGAWSVYVGRRQEYRLHLPKNASSEHRVPLLIWLTDDGLTAADGLDLWRERLGNEAAIAVLEPLYREVQPDLSPGGRWFRADTFAADVGSLVTTVEGAWGYILRHYPIDPTRFCLAGEGAGATVVAATALLTERMPVHAVAFNPQHYAKIKDFPLPLPELLGDETPPNKALRVVANTRDQSWWRDEAREYADIGFATSLSAASDDAWARELETENALRGALGLAARSAAQAADRRYIVANADSPRAWQWARLQALRRTTAENGAVAVLDAPPSEEGAQRISTDIHAASFAAPDALPKCPGPFGGTTVLAVPGDEDTPEVQAWLALAKEDPLNKASRFHRLRIACDEEHQRLPDVLETLHAEGRENVLIVPATFCADASTMRALERSVQALENTMTIQWLPGLGGRNVPSVASEEAAARTTPVSHKLSVVLRPEEHLLSVADTIELPRGLSRAGAAFTLDAALEIQSCDPPVQSAPADDASTKRYVMETAPKDGLVHVSYEGKIDYGLSEQKEEYTRGFRESRGVLGPEGVYLHGESVWVPVFDEGLIRFELTAQAPDGWQVISEGSGTARGADGRAHWDSDGPVEAVDLVCGPLHVERDSAGAVEVLMFLHEPDEALSRKYLDATARYIEMYRKLIGPYPYPKFALVENFWETGYGLPSFTLLGPQVIRFPFILNSSYPHEILHNWWGNSVFVDYAGGNWCEGLTAYLADHLIQEQQGQGAPYRRSTLQKYRDYVKEGRDFPLAKFRARHSASTEAVGYGKALMLFHMLRRQLGDDPFRAGLVTLYREQRGKRASFTDVQAAFEHASDKDLGAFFKQWTTRTGAPKLTLSDVAAVAAGKQFKISGLLNQTQTDEPFALEVPLYVRTEAGLKSFVVATTTQIQPFEIPVDSRPLAVAADPLFDVFRILDPLETPPSIGQVFGEPEILAVLPSSSAGAPASDPYRALIAAWQSDDHHIKAVVETELDALPDDRAVWILGRDNRFARSIVADGDDGSIEDAGATMHLAAQQVPFADHSLVVVRRHPGNVEKAIGWIVVNPPAAAAGLARKLPHYGKYSYLAFEGDEPTNVVKGQWGVSHSPLVVNLDPDKPIPLDAFAEDRPPLAELPPVFSRQALTDHVNWLAAPERNGRGLGTAELDAAAEYIRQQFESAGLQPGGDDGTWFQRFTVANGPEGTPVEAMNVVGVLPGTHAGWDDQSVVLSAHYDHLGRGWPDVHEGDQGKLHPGADDNASGVAVLLELARNLAAEGHGMRNLVVIAFSAEEAGRAGSKYYVEHPRFPLAGIRGVINLDTVGRLFDGKVSILGTGTADEWQHIFRGCGFVTGVKNQIVPDAAEASDQASFIERGVPGVQIFTGAHSDYHRPTDTPDKVDGAGLVQVATFVKEAVTFLLEREAPLTIRINHNAATAAGSQPAPPGEGGRKVLFGVVPDFDFRKTGVRVSSLVADSPAARAGLQADDVLLRLGDQEIADLAAFSRILKTLTPGQEVEATIVRDGTKRTVKVVVQQR
jgi:aminopeptidase N